MKLPNRVWYQGAPGSTWSGIAQMIESVDGFNLTDRKPHREYDHHGFDHTPRDPVAPGANPIFIGHRGAFFGKGMEFEAVPTAENVDQAWDDPGAGTQLVKSHEWCHQFETIIANHPNDWIVLVYRSDLSCFAWQHQVGGFTVKYPNYEWYQNSMNLFSHIMQQNQRAMEFGFKHNLAWEHFGAEWIEKHFGQKVNISKMDPDVLVTVYKPEEHINNKPLKVKSTTDLFPWNYGPTG